MAPGFAPYLFLKSLTSSSRRVVTTADSHLTDLRELCVAGRFFLKAFRKALCSAAGRPQVRCRLV